MPEGGLSGSRGDATGHPASPVHRPDDLDSLILALDFPSSAAAFSFLDRLPRARPRWVKVGLELYLSAGSAIVPALKARGHKVFLDLKLHDIPNTVARAVRTLLPLEADMLTLHAAGGSAMLAAAVQAAASFHAPPRFLAVTVLTSMNAQELAATGVDSALRDQVLRLALLARDAGVDGMVASAHETSMLRSVLPGAHIVNPGIRASGAIHADQQRVMTAGDALRAGASQLVIGRPITEAADPAHALTTILEEIGQALP